MAQGSEHRQEFLPQLKLCSIQEARQGGFPIHQVCEKYDVRPGHSCPWEKMAEEGVLEALHGSKYRSNPEVQIAE